MVAIVLVGFNSRKYLDDCLQSIQASHYKKYEIIFVDNFSTDDSVAYIRQHYPAVTIIENPGNYGFAKANNSGINYALAHGANAVFLLNIDTVLDPDCLGTLVKESDKKTVLQPLILLHDHGKKTHLINTTGNYLNFLGVSYCSGYRTPENKAMAQEIPAASGAGLFVPKPIMQAVGGLDERFFMYHEDLDWSWRARKLGFTIRLIPQAKLWHKYAFSRNKTKMFYVERNRLLFLFKHFSSKTLILISPMLVLQELLALALATKEGYLGPKLRSYGQIIGMMPYYLSYRKAEKRIKTDRDLKFLIGGGINFSEVKVPFLSLYNRMLEAYWRTVVRWV